MVEDRKSDRSINVGRDASSSVFVSGDGNQITYTQTQILQVSASEVKTRPFIIASPYKGLKNFEQTDRERFFGREQFICQLVNDLNKTNLLLLLGASGSGKSSVIRAGLMPKLAQQWGDRFINLTFTPDDDPFESLYASLLRHYGQTETQFVRQGRAETLVKIVEKLKSTDAYWLIFIDQFEELFTTSQVEKGNQFIAGLVQLKRWLRQFPVQNCSVKIVAAMRSDLLDRLSPHPALVKATDHARPIIAELQLDELRLAIEQPAAQHGVVFEDGLVEEIIKNMEGQAGCLPLLQYTLNLLWETEVETGSIHDRTLNISTYRELGGVRGALKKHIDLIYEALSPDKQLAAQQIFLKLVDISKSVELATDWKPVRRRVLRSAFGDGLEQQVLTQLIDANLLVSDCPLQTTESTVEVAHEVLLTAWTTLETWVQENRQAIALRNRLDDDVAHWKEKKSEDELWSGSKLAQALELSQDETFNQVLGGFNEQEKAFIAASLAVRDRQLQKTRRTATVGFALAALAGMTSLIAGYQLQQAERQRAQQLAATAEALLESEPVNAIIHAIAAVRLNQSVLVRFSFSEPLVDPRRTLHFVLINQERNLLQHEDGVLEVAFSPSQNVIVSGSRGRTVRLWNAATGRPIGQPLYGHGQDVWSVDFSPDGKTIVSGSEDTTIRLWDVNTGKPIGQPLRGHEDTVKSVAFSPDGKTIVSGSWDTTIRLWDVNTGEPIGQPLRGHEKQIEAVTFSPDGETIASGSEDQTIRLWDVSSGKSIGQPLRGHEDAVSSTAFSPDGKILVSGSNDGTIRLWDINTLKLIGKPLRGHRSTVYSVAFSRDGKTIVSSSEDNTVRLWNIGTRFPIGQPLLGHDNGVRDVVFSPDGRTILSASKDETLRLWNSETGRPIGKPLHGHLDGVYTAAFSPDGTTIVSGGKDRVLRFWNAHTGQLIGQPLRGHNGWILSVAFSPNGKTIASGSKDTTLGLWDAETKRRIAFVRAAHKDGVYSVAFSPDGKTLVSGGWDNSLRLWNAKTGTLIGQPLRGHDDKIWSVAFSPDGKTIVSGSRDKTVRLWDVNTREPIGQPLRGHLDAIYSVAFSPNGKMIVSGGYDKTVHLWDARTGKQIDQPLRGHGNSVWSVAFSPDSQMIISGGEDGTIRLWSIAWEPLLRAACEQLRYHPTLNNPQTEVAREAKRTCEQYR